MRSIVFFILLFYKPFIGLTQSLDLDSLNYAQGEIFQYTIQGRVDNGYTKKYLKSVDVLLVYEGKVIQSTLSNEFGKFKLEWQTNHQYYPDQLFFKVERDGFYHFEKNQLKLILNGILNYNIELRPIKSKHQNRNSTLDYLDHFR